MGADGVRIGAGAGLTVKVVTGADGSIAGTTGGGLRPAAPSSVEPNGIPVRPPDDAAPAPVGDEADAAGVAWEVPPLVGQPPDVAPPPSKVDIEPDMPVLELELAVPHGITSVDNTPDVVGLTPGDASSVAPSGTPVGATAEPGPMPSGDVIPSGDPPTWATAEPQATSAAAVAATKRINIVASPFDTPGCRLIYTRLRRYAVGVRPVVL
jgi:hypothetical protein